MTDVNKWKIVEAGALPHYVTLLSPQRSESEQTEAARGLWLLAFTCKENIIKQPGCLDGRYFVVVIRPIFVAPCRPAVGGYITNYNVRT